MELDRTSEVTNMNISALIKGSRAEFKEYRNGILYYFLITQQEDPDAIMTPRIVYVFPVPCEDAVGATFKNSHSAIELMRWVRKSMQDGTLIKQRADNPVA